LIANICGPQLDCRNAGLAEHGQTRRLDASLLPEERSLAAVAPQRAGGRMLNLWRWDAPVIAPLAQLYT